MYNEPRHNVSRHSVRAFAPSSNFGRYFARHDFAARRPAITTLKISIAGRRPGRPPKFPTFLVPRRIPAGSLMGISIRIRRLARVTDKGRTSLFQGEGPGSKRTIRMRK